MIIRSLLLSSLLSTIPLSADIGVGAAPNEGATVLFDDEAAFTNTNTAQELQRLQTPAITPGVMQAGNRDDGLPVDGLA